MDAPKTNPTTVIMPIDEANRYGATFAKSRLFMKLASDTPADVVPFKLAAIVMAGAELGFAPFASISGISIVEGKPRLGYQLLGALIRRSGKYDYRVQKLTDEVAEIEFRQLTPDYSKVNASMRWESLGVSTFSVEDAKTAGLLDKNASGKVREPWHKYRRNMLFARAMTNGVNFFCPDVAAGVPIYADDEGERDVERDEDEGRPLRLAVAAAASLAKAPPAVKTLEAELAESTRGSLARIDAAPAVKPTGPLPEVAKKIAEERAAEKPKVLEAPAAKPADPNAMRSKGVCSSCKADIWWGKTAAGADCPFNADGVSHFATCPNAADHSGAVKRRRRTKAEIAADDAKDAAEKEVKAKALEAKAQEPTSTAPDPFETGTPIPETVEAPIAKEVGLTHGDDHPLAPDAAPAAQGELPTSGDPVPGPTATEPEAHPDMPENVRAAADLLPEVRAVPDGQEVSGKQASSCHQAGINFYGSDANARAAWVAVSYLLPKRGEKITKKPTGLQAYKYLTLILDKAAERSAATNPTDES